MGADEREFKIRITTTADTSGAQAAAGALDKTTGATQEAAKATEKHTGGLQAMHKVFHSLNEVVPGLGVLMQAAFSPVGAAISMAVLALRTFQEHTRKVNEEFKRLEEEAAKPFTRRLEAMRDGTVSLAAAQAELNQRLEHTSHSERSLREEIDKALESQKREVALTREVSDAQEKKELSGLAALHEAGLLSEERYFALKLAAEEQYLKKKRSLEEAEEMRGIQAQRRALEKAELEQEGWEGHPGLRQKAEAAVAEKAKAIEDLASFDKPGIDERHKKTQQKLKEFEGGHNEEVGWFEQAGGAYATRESLNELMRQQGRATYGTAQFGNFDKWQSLKWAADASEKEWKKAPGEEAGKKVAADNATAAAERASKKAEAAQDLIDEYRRTLPEKRAAFDERHAANVEADQAQNVAARNAMKSTPGGAAVAGGSEALHG